jgi:site-specific DNA recombinase
MCKAVGYIRVSTETQVNNGQGLDIQEQEIKSYCNKNNIKLIEVFRDEAMSGANENRQGINELLEYVKENDIDRVIIHKLDRLSRDTMYGLFIRKELKKIDVELLSIKEENISGNDPIQNLMQTIIFAFAEFEKEQISNRMLLGRRSKAEKGIKASGNCPFGYRYKYNESGKNPVVVIDDDKYIIVKDIFNKYLYGMSLQKIADNLNNNNIMTNSNKPWSKQSIQVILKNKFYIGIVEFDDIEKNGLHEPIVSKIMFNRVQSLLNSKRKH